MKLIENYAFHPTDLYQTHLSPFNIHNIEKNSEVYAWTKKE